MAPNRGVEGVEKKALKVAEMLVILLLFNCVYAHALEGLMNDKDQDLLRQTGKSCVFILIFFKSNFFVSHFIHPLSFLPLCRDEFW